MAACPRVPQARMLMFLVAGSRRHVLLLLIAILLNLFPPTGSSSAPSAPPLAALPSLPPFPVPPTYLGCFSEHDPNVEAGDKFHGRRNVRFGRRGCSGMGGCGDGSKANAECDKHPDPAGIAPCDPAEMTRACKLCRSMPTCALVD